MLMISRYVRESENFLFIANVCLIVKIPFIIWDHFNERTALCFKRLSLRDFHLSSQFAFTAILYAITNNTVFRSLKNWLLLPVATGIRVILFMYFYYLCIMALLFQCSLFDRNERNKVETFLKIEWNVVRRWHSWWQMPFFVTDLYTLPKYSSQCQKRHCYQQGRNSL